MRGRAQNTGRLPLNSICLAIFFLSDAEMLSACGQRGRREQKDGSSRVSNVVQLSLQVEGGGAMRKTDHHCTLPQPALAYPSRQPSYLEGQCRPLAGHTRAHCVERLPLVALHRPVVVHHLGREEERRHVKGTGKETAALCE